MVELQINEPTNVPEWLFVMFAVCTTVLVAVHIFALMISTYLLPNIDAASKMSAGDVLKESPHERMRGFIELAWAFSTVLGINFHFVHTYRFLFLFLITNFDIFRFISVFGGNCNIVLGQVLGLFLCSRYRSHCYSDSR